jgi:hypothetical protein
MDYQDALNHLKRKTHEKGGNVLLILNFTTGYGIQMLGQAYKCE